MRHGHELPRLLTTAEVARFLAVSRRTLERWRWSGDGPPFMRVGGLRRYSIRDLRGWAEARKAISTRGSSDGREEHPAP